MNPVSLEEIGEDVPTLGPRPSLCLSLDRALEKAVNNADNDRGPENGGVLLVLGRGGGMARPFDRGIVVVFVRRGLVRREGPGLDVPDEVGH